MADILEWVLRDEIEVNEVLQWLRNKADAELPKKLRDAGRLRYEFVPFFLNYLRDQTLPLLQNCKSVTPSPVKTPSAQKLKQKKNFTPEGRTPGSANRIQLFSPVERPDASQLCSLDASHDTSPRLPVTPTERNQKTHYEYIPRSKQHKHSPRDNRYHHQKPAVDPHKSKHKMSLGDFLTSPDTQNNGNRRKKSPLVTVKKDWYRDDGLSPSPGTSRRANGKKRQPTPDRQLGKVKERCGDEWAAQEFNLSNSEDFPTIGGSKEQSLNTTPVHPVRRINPTPVRADMKRPQNTAFLETASVWGTPTGKDNLSGAWGAQADARGDAPLVLDMERALLRREKAKLQERTSGSGDSQLVSLTSVTPTKPTLQRESSIREPAVAQRSEVTHEDRISLLADLYTGCINQNLLPNLNVELYFLVQLLTIQDVNPSEDQRATDPEDINYFSSLHNAVFFSVLVLEKQLRLLSLLDKSTIRLLSDNPRVLDFSPGMASKLAELQETTLAKAALLFPKSPIGGVSFQADTDNRENFPSQQSFLHFKKQRDRLYELIREWEEGHMTPGWQMVEKLGARIKSLVQSKNELANHLHLARLFQSQLLTMCKGDQSYKTEGDDDQVALLTQLKKSNPAKFKRLQERFVAPMTTAGPCPPQSFPGCQEFFRDFILAASCPSFNKHLTDILSAKISELDSGEVTETDVENEEGQTERVIDEEEKEQFVSCLLEARLVGKFMGFLTFLPYQTQERFPDALLPSYLEIRAKVCLPVSVLECIDRACCHGRLVMTVPWLVEFLSMMDSLSPLLLYFQRVMSRLMQIYKLAVQRFQQGEATYNNLLLIFTLGWFFELPVLPDGVFFQGFSDIQSVYPEPSDLSKQLDSMDLIDQQVLYTCCPYLVEIRSLLLEFAVGRSNNNATIRKITPIAADGTPTPSVTEKHLQLHMEENFFHNHPASLKRVVEFVAERTASNYIKKLRSSTLNLAFVSAKGCVSKMVSNLSGVSPNNRIKEKLSHDVLKEAGSLCERVRCEVSQSLHTYCQGKIVEALPLLLPDEQIEAVVSVSVSISCRQAEERVNQWINNHITKRIFQREMSEELEKMCRPVNLQKMIQTVPEWKESVCRREEPVVKPTSIHNDDTQGPTDCLTDTKVYLSDVILYRISPTSETLSTCVERVENTVSSRQDLLVEAYKSFSQMLQDLALFIMSSKPCLWSESLCCRCLSLWTGALKQQVQFSSMFCSRLLLWFSKSTDPQVSWRELTQFVLKLLEKDLVTDAQLHKSVLSILNLSLDMGVFEKLAELVITVMESSGRSPEKLEEWSEMIDTLHSLSENNPHIRHCLEQLTSNVGVSNEEGSSSDISVSSKVCVISKAAISSDANTETVSSIRETPQRTVMPSGLNREIEKNNENISHVVLGERDPNSNCVYVHVDKNKLEARHPRCRNAEILVEISQTDDITKECSQVTNVTKGPELVTLYCDSNKQADFSLQRLSLTAQPVETALDTC